MTLKTRFLTMLATGLSALSLACGGGAGQASYPGPAPITLMLQNPPEGATVDHSVLLVEGQVSQPDAFVACQGKPVSVDAQGLFKAEVQLRVGQNQIEVDAWSAQDAKTGRGSSLLPPPEKVAARVTRNLMYQVPPLRLTISAPVDGATFTVSGIDVKGAVNDPTAAVTLNGNPLSVSADGHVSEVYRLQEGRNTLAFEATASEGRKAEEIRTVTYVPPRPLAVAILNPSEGLLTRAATLVVSGTVTNPNAGLTVFGQSVVARPDGGWALTITPPEGAVSILAQAADSTGKAEDLRHITVDRTPPVITCPVPPMVADPVLQLTGTVDDPKAHLTLSGQPLPLSDSGTFSTPVHLTPGLNTFKFEAVDAAGNVGALVASTTFLPPLVLTITSPVDHATFAAPDIAVQGSVSEPAATVTLNGNSLAVDPSGHVSGTYRLQPGLNALLFQAAASGNRLVAETRNVTYAPVAPKALRLTVAAPAEGLLTRADSVVVSGTVSDPGAVLTVFGTAVTAAPDGSWSLVIAPPEGAVAIHAQAVAGSQTAEDVRHITVDRTPPHITLTHPVPTLTNQPLLSFAGQVDDPSALLTLENGTVPLSGSGAFTGQYGLREGGNTLHFRAVDPAGNVGTLDVPLVLDTVPPVITLTKPIPAMTRATSVDVVGTVNEPVSAMTLNGSPLAFQGQSFSTSAPLPQEGANAFLITATDLAGNTGQLSLSTTRKTEPPVIHIDQPMDGYATRLDSVEVHGHVDDPTNAVELQGSPVAVDATGQFQGVIRAPRLGVLGISATATDEVGNTAAAKVYVSFETDPPLLAWADPTPPEGATLSVLQVPAAVTVSKAALVSINGQPTELEPNEGSAMTQGVAQPLSGGAQTPAYPFKAQADISVQEGQVVLTATAVDKAGNTSTITRTLGVGFSAPHIVVETPVFDAQGRFTTSNLGVTLTGRVESLDVVKPLTFSVNGQSLPLTADGRFSVPLSLVVGMNPAVLTATTRFQQKDTQSLTVVRIAGVADPGSAPSIAIDWPRQGFASGTGEVLVKGHVGVPGMTATLKGASVSVDPQSLTFSGVVSLQPGPNTITALGTDPQGRTATDSVQGTYVQPGSATYTWLLPSDGTHVQSRTVTITGKADHPGIVGITVNGVPMSLDPEKGTFQGQVDLQGPGRNALVLQATLLSGDTRSERREVIFEPSLPQIRLMAPATARPGEVIPLQVLPAQNTTLAKADLSWNGRLLASVMAPWAPVQAQVPADAVVGSQILVEALGTDSQGATVTARTYVSVYGSGALLVEAYDDARGLPLSDGKATAGLDDGTSPAQPLDAHGRAALATALPQSWIKVSEPGFTPVWRSGGLLVGGAQAVVDARLTRMVDGRSVEATGFEGDFLEGLIHASLPSGALSGPGSLSMTPLTSQGLPGLLPAGWSAVSAWWVGLNGANFLAPGALRLNLSQMTGAQALPAEATYAWVHWDPTLHAWTVLAAPRSASTSMTLPLPDAGGYALVLADAAPTTPPDPVAGSVLAGVAAPTWRDGLKSVGSLDPSILPTVEAIHGAQSTAAFTLGFAGGAPVPSGTLIQTDVQENYTLIDQSVIEPDGFTQDAVAARWMLDTKDGKPVLAAAGTADEPALGLRLPVRMSRTFGPTDLVEGHIYLGFYHDGVQVAAGGSGLIGASGGSVSQDGITATLAAGAVSGSTLVRIQPDPGDPAPIWPELSGKGAVLRSFTLDVVGTLTSGLGLRLDSLDVPAGTHPLLVQRRTIQGQRRIVAVGEWVAQGSSWMLSQPPEGNPVLEGGAFAVLLPTKTWGWVSGTATLPGNVAQPLMKKLGSRARMALSRSQPGATEAPDAAVADVVVEAGFLSAVSGPTGTFAVPALIPEDATGTVLLRGTRWDLGVAGQVSAQVPSPSNLLRLTTTPFRVETVIPDPASVLAPSAVFTLLVSAPADPATLDGVNLLQDREGTPTRVDVRASLSQDGKTLLVTPIRALEAAGTYHLVVDGLAGLGGDVAPKLDLTYTTAAIPSGPTVDWSRVILAYPDANLNVAITVPESAVPSGASLEIEAPGMGSVYAGTMPAQGDLTFTLKASLGERLHARAQLLDGRTVEGWLSRYEARDGSGRVTIGVDGGRVESTDGSGAAVILPEGAIDHPVEFQAIGNSGPPSELDPKLAAQETFVGRVDLRASEPVTLAKHPVVEIQAPANPSLDRYQDGLGPYAVFDRVEGFEEDGEPCVYFEFSDTASVHGRLLRSQGGLPEIPLGVLSDSPGRSTNPDGLGASSPRLMGNAGLQTSLLSHSKKAIPPPVVRAEGIIQQGLLVYLAFAAVMYVAGPHYMSGSATIDIPGQPPGQPAVGAYIYYSKDDVVLKRSGQMLGRTNDKGWYLFSSSISGEYMRGFGLVMGVDKDFGVRDTSPARPFPPTVNGTYIHVPAMHFVVSPTQLADHQPPYTQVAFQTETYDTGAHDPGGSVPKGQALWLEVKAGDNKDGDKLAELTCTLDGKITKLDQKNKAKTGLWRIPHGAGSLSLPVGHHTVDVYARDASGNESRVRREIDVLDFSVGENLDGPPDAEVYLEPDRDHARVDLPIRIEFTKAVTIPSAAEIKLESSSGVPAAFQLVGPSGPVTGSITGRVVYVVPSPSLAFKTTYQLTLSAQVKGAALGDALKNDVFEFATTQVRDQEEQDLSFTPGKIAALGSRLFVEDTSHKRVEALTLNTSGKYDVQDVAPMGISDFMGQDIDALAAFPCVPMGNGTRQDLLLVTTSPRFDDVIHQAVLWAFEAYGKHQLVFAVSLGQGASGYAPNLDCRDGIIAVGRLSSSVLLIDAGKAKKGWDNWITYRDERGKGLFPGGGEWGMVLEPRGVNVQAIVQPFYLTNPEATVMPSNWGVALVPSFNQSGSMSELDVSVGTIAPGMMWSQTQPLSGLPTYEYSYVPGVDQNPRSPFESDPSHGGANKHLWPGVIRKPVLVGTTQSVGFPGKKQAVWANANVKDASGTMTQTNLVVGVSPMSPLNGAEGNSLVVMEEPEPSKTSQVGVWPDPKIPLDPSQPFGQEEPPFAKGVQYEIAHKVPQIDPLTGYCAVQVYNRSKGGSAWFILDLNTPSSPKTLAKLDGNWAWGTMSDGIFYGVSAGAGGKGILGKKVLSNAAFVNNAICGESCNLEAPTDPQLVILSVEGKNKVTQGHGYDITEAKNHNFNASSCYPISIPANGKSNTTPVYILLAIQHPDSISFEGLCLIAKTKDGETDILTNQKVDGSVLIKDDKNHPSTDVNGISTEYYLANVAMQRGIKSNLYHKTALDLSYQLVAYGKTPAGQVVRSNLKLWSSSENIAWHLGDEVPLWPLYWAEETGAKEYDLGNKERWCAAGVFRFLANPANASLIVPYGAISKEHGGPTEGHHSHQLGTDVDFMNPGADVLAPISSGTDMHTKVASLLDEAKKGNKDSLEKLKQWINASRARLQKFIDIPTVGQVFFGADKNASIISVLIGGDKKLGISGWKVKDKYIKYKSDLNDDKKGGSHWNHFHVTFDPRYISQEK